jgi:hypothetical protein
VRAAELVPGDTVATRAGTATVVRVAPHDAPEVVYNLRVERTARYLVGACGAVVHNSPCSEAAEAAGKAARLQANKAAGDAFRDQIADELRRAGKDVATEVRMNTPLGPRVIDVEVRVDGVGIGGIEAKSGGARRGPRQRAKDEWLRENGYPIHEVRNR